jgi:hypothetical protein
VSGGSARRAREERPRGFFDFGTRKGGWTAGSFSGGRGRAPDGWRRHGHLPPSRGRAAGQFRSVFFLCMEKVEGSNEAQRENIFDREYNLCFW